MYRLQDQIFFETTQSFKTLKFDLIATNRLTRCTIDVVVLTPPSLILDLIASLSWSVDKPQDLKVTKLGVGSNIKDSRSKMENSRKQKICITKYVSCGANNLHHADTSCKASSQYVLIQNYFLIMHISRFSRRLRQMP